ncbi:MAG: DinB family protein [Gemmatimonadaceae bacterium]|nr:DinB family protein [Gemmatimonadaceae bacterium]
MFRNLDDFRTQWSWESDITSKLIGQLTDASLAQAVVPGGRTLGRLAWHIAQTLPEMMNLTGLEVTGIDPHAPAPGDVSTIKAGFDAASASLIEQINAKWTDASLTEMHDMYGERWSAAQALLALVAHQAHHRGQMTVLMRQAGLKVPGIYGPAEEEWAAMGMQPPPV